MQIKKLWLHNFKSFHEGHEFNFEGRPNGLHLVTGRNELYPKLGGNATGKSTLFTDGPCWVMYGKTTRKLKAGEVSTWEAGKETEGTLDLDIAGEPYTIERGWNPNYLKLTRPTGLKVTIDQDHLDKQLGMSYEEFCHSVVLGQFGQVFFDLKPEGKLQLFSDVLGLDRWISYSDKCSADAKKLDARCQTEQNIIENKRGSLVQAEDSLQENHEQSRLFAKEKAKKVAALLSEVENYDPLIQEHQELVEQCGVTASDLENQQSGLSAELEGYASKLNKVDGDLRELLQLQGAAGRVYDGIIASIKRVNALGDSCPHCLQSISASHVRGQKDVFLKQKDESLAEQAEISNKVFAKEEEATKVRAEKKVKTEKAQGIIAEYRVAQSHLQLNETTLNRIKANKDAANRIYESEKNKTNPYDATAKTLKQRIDQLKGEVADMTIELACFMNKLGAAQYWVKGFKEVRLYLITEALTSLEVEVNNALVGLGLEDWKITFDVERETKAGSVSKGFHVMVQAPGAIESVPWEAWSGGETQRLRMSGAIGLSNLINSRSHDGCNLFVLDEPTAHLGGDGIRDLLTYLADYGKTENKQVWLIDHHSLDFGDLAGSITVVKDANGSHIVENKVVHPA